MKFSSLFSKFIDNGTKPTTAQEQSAILDEARSVILDISRRAGTGEIKVADQIDLVAAQYANLRPSIVPTAKKQPIFNRQASAPVKPSPPAAKPASSTAPTAAAKPLPSPAPAPAPKPAQTTAKPAEKVVSAAEFLESRPVRVMAMGEFRKLSATDKNEWIRSGGKLKD